MKTIKIEQSGDFVLYKKVYPRKSYATTHGYYRNTKTNENCGKYVEVYDGDEDCYELVAEAMQDVE